MPQKSFLNLGIFPSSPAVISVESPPVHQRSQRGRTKFEITREALIGLREIGHSEYGCKNVFSFQVNNIKTCK